MKRTLNIMILSRRAGLEVQFLNYLKHMEKNAPELLEYQYVLGINTSEYFTKELVKLGVTLFNHKKNKKFDLSLVKLARKIVKDYSIDIVYGQNFLGNTLATLISLFNTDIKTICHEHGTSWNVKGLNTFLTFFWINKADIIICNSKAAAILLNKRFNANKSKIRIILNGVIGKTEVAINKSNNKLLFVGRLDEVKSPHTLIYMMKQLVEKDENIILDILGDGNCERELRKITSTLNLNNNIYFHGNVEDVSGFMRRATLLILPSVREPLGNVIIEAAYQETPSVASKIDGIPEVIIDNETGILIEPTEKLERNIGVKYVVNTFKEKLEKPKSINSNKLAKEILGLLQNNDQVCEMGVKAKQHVSEKFTIERYFNEIKNELYN